MELSLTDIGEGWHYCILRPVQSYCVGEHQRPLGGHSIESKATIITHDESGLCYLCATRPGAGGPKNLMML